MSSMSPQSAVRLGFALAKVLVKNAVDGRPQLARFEGAYAPDGVLRFSAEDVAVTEAASRCTGCKRCDVVAALEGMPAPFGGLAPSAFVLGPSRHSSEHDVFAEMPGVPASLLEAMTTECPETVPFVALDALVRRRAASLRAHRLPVRAAS